MTADDIDLLPGVPERVRLRATGETIAVRDYARLYRSAGLYEAVVQDALGCQSPQACAQALLRHLPDAPSSRVLDLGAGVGLVGERLRAAGVGEVIGLDVIPEARDAALRDRPEVHGLYLVDDLATPIPGTMAALERVAPTAITCAGALGGGHVAAVALGRAIDLLPPGGLLALTIGEAWLSPADGEGLGALLAELIGSGGCAEVERVPFVHRRTTTGEPIVFVCCVLRRDGAR